MSRAKRDIQSAFAFWFGPSDPARLQVFEKALVLTFAFYMFERFRYAKEWLTAYGLHLTPATKSHQHIDPFPLLPEPWIPVIATVVFAVILAVLLGWHRRIMMALLLVWAIYIQNVDIISSFTLNKIYIASFALLTLAPPVLTLGRGSNDEQSVQSAWVLRTLQATLIIMYFTAGTCKVLGGDWLTHSDTLWTQVQGLYCTDIAAWMLRTLPKESWAVQMYSALLFELSAPLLFMWRRTRWIGIFWGLGFHVLIAATMHQLIYFSLQLVVFYLLFIPDSMIRRIPLRLRDFKATK